MITTILNHFFSYLEMINNYLWEYFGIALIIGLGAYFTIKSKFFQVIHFPSTFHHFLFGEKEAKKRKDSSIHAESDIEEKKSSNPKGIHPIKTLITVIGGSIGIGNVIGILTAIQIGGPGALFWTWIAGLMGMLLQYSEVYLGMLYRVPNEKGGYNGGPMYFLQKAFKSRFIPILAALFLAIYGVELFMFNVITESISVSWHINRYLVVALLLGLVFLSVSGGIKRISTICSFLLPIFLFLYMGSIFFVLFSHASAIPSVFALIFKSAFTAKGAVGGAAGSMILLTIGAGLSRGAYAGDLGIGFNSMIHTESNTQHPHKQAALTMIGIFFNTFILCSLSTLLVLVTDVWKTQGEVVAMIQSALSMHFPYMNYFIPLLLFLLGYLTITTYFFVGLKSADFLSKKWGKKIYFAYALIFLPLCAFVKPTHAFLLMNFSGGILMILNFTGIFRLRHKIRFQKIEG